ncbi:hypothetical protein L6164_002722 [Bauhinia variegata]|uniref:Uncharacterized protein n=1 Tax=Bauhinia variegata TaxID=167791 RepID=A0ACB9Q4K7_BAUVA|nr:hypothetical protein L6164_002722 [Bauhinia variegata]
MKTIFFAFFLLSAFSTTLPSTSADFVYDTDGEPLRNGGSYHIKVSELWGDRLRLGRSGNETCPQTVVLARSEISPVKLSTPYKILYIFEGMLISISFTRVPKCVPEISEWDVVDEGSVKQVNVQRFVGPFKIVKSESHDYKLVYCPGDDDSCEDLKIHNRLLNVKDGKSFGVRFERAVKSSPQWSIV